MTEEEFTGETVIEDEVVASVVGLAAKEIEGVAGLGKSSVRRILAEHLGDAQARARGVEVEVGKTEAIVDLELTIVYGFYIPSVVDEVRKKVASRLLEITGLTVKEINVHIVNLTFPEKTDKMRRHIPESPLKTHLKRITR